MDNFIYESHTPGHALKPTVILPEMIKQLKAFCSSKKCKPVEVLEALYEFQTENQLQRTFNHVVIRCQKGTSPAKGKESIAYLITHTHFAWEFGIVSQRPLKDEETRYC